MSEINLPPKPAINLDLLFKRRDTWIAAITPLPDVVGPALTQTSADLITSTLRKLVPANCRHDALDRSVAALIGMPMTAAVVRDLCHRLAGNVHRLAVGRPAEPWRMQRMHEWAPFQIMNAEIEKRNHQLGHKFVFKVLAGTPAALFAARFWTEHQCSMLSRKFGFDRRQERQRNPPRYPFFSGVQLVGMRFWAVLHPRPVGEAVSFGRVEASPDVRPHNRLLLKRRFRVDPGFSCPQGRKSEFLCQRCPAGYATCPAATHRDDYIQKMCPNCEKDDAWFDPANKSNVCVDCRRNRVLHG